MKINKYNKPKENSGAGRTSGGSSTTIIKGSTSDRAAYSDESGRLSETHLIFGQPFDGTSDVAGDLSNVQNITATGGDITVNSVTDIDGTKGGNIFADGDINAGGNVTGVKFIGDVDAGVIDTDIINAELGNINGLTGEELTFNYAEIQQAIIDTLASTNITTENLTVTKQAHFFELIIDKIKAAGGALLLTPADGFKIEMVISAESSYRLLWRSQDGEKARQNMWRVGDQAICQTLNNGVVGYNVLSNKYYWALVTAVGSEILGNVQYNYIDLSKSEYDGILNPQIGDEIAMLGHRGTEDEKRQSAIYLTAYTSLDSTLTAPLICHYKGINDFNLSSHKYTWFAANGNEIRGNLKVESGASILDVTNSIKAIVVENQQGINTNTQNIATIMQTANGLKSTVESHTTTLGQHTTKISEIEQTADNIRMQVEDVALRIDDKKIVLDGDTEIKGDLTMDNSTQGLVLIGNGGITQMKPTSIGSYEGFSSKSSQIFRKEGSGSITLSTSSTVAVLDLEHQIGYIKSGVYLQLNQLSYSSIRGNKSAPVTSVTFQLFRDGNYVGSTASVTITNPTTGNFLTYTTNAAGNYTVKIRIINSFSGSTTVYNSNTVTSQIAYNVVLPTDAITILGYDGYASNFGNNKVVYLGGEKTVISYGDAKLRFSTTGIEKYAGSTGSRRMNNGIYSDTALSEYATDWVSLNGCVVRKVTSGGDVYIQQNDELIIISANSGTVNINLLNANNFDSIGVSNKNMVGRKIYIKKIGECTVNILGYTGADKNLVNPDNGNLVESYNPQGRSMMVISDGQHWNLFYCG